MNTSIYQVAMYEIIQKIRTACPTYNFYDIYENEKCNPDKVLDELFEFTDELHTFFPEIDVNTYVMVVCGTIMQCYVSELASISDMDEAYFERLSSPFADEKTKKYFGHIYYAIDEMSQICHYDEYREIDEWPASFPLVRHKRGGEVEGYRKEVFSAIELCPTYPYAYCLLTVFHFNSLSVMDFGFQKEGDSYEKAFLRSHRYMGKELFRFVMVGNFGIVQTLTYGLLEDDGEREVVQESVKRFVEERGYTVDDVRGMAMRKGYFLIDGKRYPGGIPYFCYFPYEEFVSLIDEAMDNPADSEDGERVYKHYPIYNGLMHLMPIYDSYSVPNDYLLESIRQDSVVNIVSTFLDASATELDKLEAVNQELARANEHLNRHMKLNQELVRSLSHSSANYLNSEKLAHTGTQLHRAEVGSPSVDELHSEGLSLLLQSEQEMFLSRQLNSLVWRCSAKVEDLMRQIREGLAMEEGLGILSPIEFAMKTVMARVLFRAEDRRGEYIRNKMPKAAEMTQIRSSFMLDILAEDGAEEGSVLRWWNEFVAPFEVTVSTVWRDLYIVKDKAFYDLVVEITIEQILNALSHGDIAGGIRIELGQENNRFGRPIWAFISCINQKGTAYKGGRGVGVSTLKETLLLLSSDARGIEVIEEDGMYESKAWILKNFLEPMEGEAQ